MKRLILSLTVVAAAILGVVFFTGAEPGEKKDVRIPNRPKVPGKLRLNLRERRGEAKGSGLLKVALRSVDWEVAETAIIVCDMWDDHHCKIAAQRVGVMAPRMNQVLTAARDRGVMIIFAPSETMNIYAGSPYRKRMEQAKAAKPPAPIAKRYDRDPACEPKTLPEDTELDCDDCELGPVVRRHTRQHPGLDIIGFDGISDNGQEIYNFCAQEGIKNIVLMGVHTNYCILARPFGIRQMLKVGKNVVLARDLTDALYDPRQPPHVSHARGTEIVVEHIETFDKIGTTMMPEFMSADQRFAARRPDVLVYESEALAKEVTLAGPSTAQLHVSTTGADADCIVKLIDVFPDDYPDPSPNPSGVRMGGYQQLVRGEVLRGRFRNSFEKPEAFEPGRPTVVAFKLPDVCHTFRPGHKVMVQVHSSWFPLVDRNPQTFVDIARAKESDFRKATQRVYRSKEMPSRLVVQTLP